MKIFTASSTFLLSFLFFLAVDAASSSYKNKEKRYKPKAKKVRRPLKEDRYSFEEDEVVLSPVQAKNEPFVKLVNEPVIYKKNLPVPKVVDNVQKTNQAEEESKKGMEDLQKALDRKERELSELKLKYDDLADIKNTYRARLMNTLLINKKLTQDLAASCPRPDALRTSRQAEELQALRRHLSEMLGMKRNSPARDIIEMDKFVKERLIQMVDRLFNLLERSNRANQIMREYIINNKA